MPNIAMTNLPRDTPDRRTSLADLRTALCLHTGVDIDDIDPASGHDLSLSSYLTVRAQWESHIKEYELSAHTEAGHARALAKWRRRRPEYLTEHPWPTPEQEGAE